MTKPSGVVHRQMFEQMKEQRDEARVRIEKLVAALEKHSRCLFTGTDSECAMTREPHCPRCVVIADVGLPDVAHMNSSTRDVRPAFNADCDRECSAVFYKKGYFLPVKHSEFCPHYAASGKPPRRTCYRYEEERVLCGASSAFEPTTDVAKVTCIPCLSRIAKIQVKVKP